MVVTPHPILRFTGPAVLIGAAATLFGALLVTEAVTLPNGLLIGIVSLCFGIGLVIFGMMTRAAWRIVMAANDDNNTAQTGEQE
jgi:hypothetical protein